MITCVAREHTHTHTETHARRECVYLWDKPRHPGAKNQNNCSSIQLLCQKDQRISPPPPCWCHTPCLARLHLLTRGSRGYDANGRRVLWADWQPHRVNSYDCVTICYICKCARVSRGDAWRGRSQGTF